MIYLTKEEKAKVLSKIDTSVKQEYALISRVYRTDFDNAMQRAWEMTKAKINLSAQYTEYSLHEAIKLQFPKCLAPLSKNLDGSDWATVIVAFDRAVDSTYTYRTEGDWAN